MTLNEFSTEFDVLYNNIMSGAAPGINAYEKSVFLTNAQEDIVNAFYNGDLKGIVASFEETEEKRRELNELVRTHTSPYDATLNTNMASLKIHENSVFFQIPDDVWFIIYEAGLTLDDPCTNKGINTKIIPMKHDYFAIQIDNPFREPSTNTSWRMDLEAYNNKKVVEIVHKSIPLKQYYIRYVHKPTPIILEDFESNPELSGMGLTINGSNLQSNTELEHLDLDILRLAVNTALKRYKENAIRPVQNTNK